MASHAQSAVPALYDFIIVGAGSASCLIASRLSQQLPGHRILVLEAGQHYRNDPNIQTPGLSATIQSNPDYDWDYHTSPEPGLNQRKVQHPRGKLVGGTSAVNSHSVVFPNHEWQDRIAKELLADPGKVDWSSQGMEDCYRRWQAGNSTTADAGVRTSYPPRMDVLQTQWIKAFEELGHVASPTGFVKSSMGAVTITNAIDSSKGERSHAGTAFLDSALKRDNVTLKTGAKVDKIVFDAALTLDGRLSAEGIRYTWEGKIHHARAREVILSAGVFESPAILERSGIGSRKILEAANIPVLYELPGVGENLQDHLNCSLSCETRDEVPTRDEGLWNPEMKKAASVEYERSRTGRLAEGPAYSFAFTPLQLLETASETQELIEMTAHAVEAEHDPRLRAQYSIIAKAVCSPIEATATTFLVRSQRHKDSDSLPKGTPSFDHGHYMTVVAMLAHPFSRGGCHVSSHDPSQRPEISFNYLSHPLDMEILGRHLRLIERLFQQPTFKALTKPDGKRLPRSFPQPVTSLEYAKEILPVNSATNYHPCGTCSMMKEDLRGVVDEQLRVYGTNNVRVCDASILPIIPRGNILTAVYAFAEKASEIICGEARTQHSSD